MRRWWLLSSLALALAVACTRDAKGPSESKQASPDQTLAPVAAASSNQTPPSASASVTDRLYIREGYGTNTQRLAVVSASSGAVERTLPLGAPAPDWSVLYTAERTGARTVVRALDPATGATRHELTLDGVYSLPEISPALAGGLSPNGRWLALASLPSEDAVRSAYRSGAAQSVLMVLDTTFATPPRRVELAGAYSFDALANDGTSLYLIEHLAPDVTLRYQVRRYDLAQRRLDPNVVVAKGEAPEMEGVRIAAMASRDGQWLYSLYHTPSGAFIHALNLDQRFALCIDLPKGEQTARYEPMLWSLGLSPSGGTLYAVHGGAGFAFEVDTGQAQVRRTATLGEQGRAPSGLFDRLARRLVPVAEAKRLPLGGAAVTPDGRTLYALGESGLLAIDTGKMELRGRSLRDWTLDSLALSPDGARLYAISTERGRVLRLDPATGTVLSEIGGVTSPWGILRVETGP